MFLTCSMCPSGLKKGDGRCPGSNHHHVGQGTGGRLQCAIHGAGHQYYDQETNETEARLLVIYVAIGYRSLGRCWRHFLGRFPRLILGPSMVEIRMENYPQDGLHQTIRQRLHARQFSLVHARIFTPGRQRHCAQVIIR